jgi:ribosome-binding ATPase
MKVGIVGMEYAGKKSLFSLLTGVKDENLMRKVGTVNVPDERVDSLSDFYKSKKKVYSQIEFNMVPSIKKSSDDTKKTLADAKLMDMFGLVVRQFKDENVFHPDGKPDVLRDYDTVKNELIFADLYLVETRLDRIDKELRSEKKDLLLKEKEILESFKASLEKGLYLNSLKIEEEKMKIVRSLNFLTMKPIFVIVNCDEGKVNEEFAFQDGVKSITVSAKIENEIQQLDENSKKEFLGALGLKEPSLNRLIKFAYSYGSLITFFTAGEKDSHAWTVKQGTPALRAAGAIHTDIEKGFIRAEIVHYDDLIRAGSEAEAKRQGLYRLEGKEYIIKDGDIAVFRFNI